MGETLLRSRLSQEICIVLCQKTSWQWSEAGTRCETMKTALLHLRTELVRLHGPTTRASTNTIYFLSRIIALAHGYILHNALAWTHNTSGICQ